MTSPSPPDPQAPQNGPSGARDGTQSGSQPDPGTGVPPGLPEPQSGSQSLEEIQAALAASRRDFAKLQREHDKLKREGMTESEKSLAKAREEGKLEAMRAQGVKVAAAEFRALAQGKLANPAAAAGVLDLSRFVDDSGEVDSAELAKAVEALAASSAPANGGTPPPRVPSGPRESTGGRDDNWLRGAIRK